MQHPFGALERPDQHHSRQVAVAAVGVPACPGRESPRAHGAGQAMTLFVERINVARGEEDELHEQRRVPEDFNVNP